MFYSHCQHLINIFTLTSCVLYLCTSASLKMVSRKFVDGFVSILGTLEPAPLRWRYVWPLETLLSLKRYHGKFGHSRSKLVGVCLQRSSWKVWPFSSCLSRSLKVIGTSADRSVATDFLLVFHSNYASVLYRFWDKWWHLQNFPTPMYLMTHWVFPLEFCSSGGDQKARMMP